MTPKRVRIEPEHWRKTQRVHLVDQLAKHGWRWPKTPDGKRNAKLAQKELAQIMIDLLGI